MTNNIKTRLLSNTIFIGLDWLLGLVLSLVFWIFLGKLLLPAEYGIVYVFINFTILVGTQLPLGTSIALFKLIPEFIGRKEYGKITYSVLFTIKLLVLIALVSSIIIFLFSGFISAWLKLPLYAVYLLPLSVFLFGMFFHQTHIMLGFQRVRKVALTAFIGNLLKVILTIFLVFVGFKVIGPIGAFILGLLVIVLLRIKHLSFKYKPVKVSWKKLISKFGFPGFLSRFNTLILISTESIILAFFYDPSIAGIFGIAMFLASQLAVIPNVFSSALFPITSFLSTTKNPENRQAYLINIVSRYTLLITIPILIFLTLFSRELIVLVSQSSYLSAAVLLPVLAIGTLLLGFANIFINSLYAIGRPELQRNIILLNILVYTVLALPLAYFFSSIGISIAYMLSALFLLIVGLLFLKRVLRFKVKMNMVKLLIANLVSFIILYLLSKIATNIWIGILFTVCVGIIYIFLLGIFKFYNKDDIKLLEMLSYHVPTGRGLFKFFIKFISKF